MGASQLHYGTMYTKHCGIERRIMSTPKKVEEKEKNRRGYLIVKRGLDFLVGTTGCVLLIPISVVIKLLYLLSGDTHSILYSQDRVGLNGKIFKMYKFRTMVPDAEEILEKLLEQEEYRRQWDNNNKLENDPRITTVGKIIRITNIDETPQFINILKGDMSLVGPRPLIPGELEGHGGDPIYQSVKPGLTGIWACSKRYEVDYDKRLDLEYSYIKNRSLGLDTKIVVRTLMEALALFKNK